MAVVIKLGGSLFQNVATLSAVFHGLAAVSSPMVLVPGGGVFADCVRDAQTQLKFDDETAHLMAIRGMEQNGHILSSLFERVERTSHLDQFSSVWERGQIPVWMPYSECEHDTVLPRDWSVSSDAIAARLAERMGDAGVLLIKSCVIDPTWRIEQMADRGLVDQSFGQIVKRACLSCRVLGAAELRLLPGVVIELEEGST